METGSLTDQLLAEIKALRQELRAADSPYGQRAEQVLRLAYRAAVAQNQTEADLERYREIVQRSLDLLSARGLEDVATQVLDAVMALVRARRGFIGLIREAPGWKILVARDLSMADIEDPESFVSTTVINNALEVKAPIVADDALHGPYAGNTSVAELRLRSIACIPVIRDDDAIGFIYLDNHTEPGTFDPSALVTVEAYMPLVSTALGRALDEKAAFEGPLPGVITRSRTMRAQLQTLSRVSGKDVPIVLTGETGTGKELVARAIHTASPRCEGPFVHVNCGAIPETLMEAELFGATAGAYTGARTARIGRFEAAEGGTLFLDELNTMPLSCQVKLLLAVQDHTITRLGTVEPIEVDVRIIAAMNESPPQAIVKGTLREELYYRLAVVEALLPPLRDRPEDVPLLAQHMLERGRLRYGLPPIRLSSRGLDDLMNHSWPGNVRELENTLDRAALLCDGGVIESVQLTAAAPAPGGGKRRRSRVSEEEFRKVWAELDGNVKGVAERLGVHPKSVFRLRRRFSVEGA